MSTVVTEDEMADLFDHADMPPWPLDTIYLPTNAEWPGLANPHLISLRIAAVTVGKSKPELIEIVEGLSNDPGASADRTAFMDMVDQIISTKEVLTAWTTLLSTAECRLMTTLAKVLQPNEDHPAP